MTSAPVRPAPGRGTSLRVAVDFGTSSTAAVVSLRGGPPQVVVVDGAPLVPSAVYAAPDGTVFVGQEAERQAAIDPAPSGALPDRGHQASQHPSHGRWRQRRRTDGVGARAGGRFRAAHAVHRAEMGRARSRCPNERVCAPA